MPCTVPRVFPATLPALKFAVKVSVKSSPKPFCILIDTGAVILVTGRFPSAILAALCSTASSPACPNLAKILAGSSVRYKMLAAFAKSPVNGLGFSPPVAMAL